MAQDHADRFGDLVRKQLAMNRETWRVLQDCGVTEATELRLDFFYYTLNRKNAEALGKLLADQTDYDVRVASSGPLFRRRWSVTGSTQSTCISLEILDQWVQWMAAAGHECDCEFDGWGTPVPQRQA